MIRRAFCPRVVLTVLSLLAIAASPLIAQEQDPQDFEAVLVPAFFFGDGASGSRWESVATVYNDAENEVSFARAVLNGDPVCDGICGCGVRSELGAGETGEICSSMAHFAGLLLYPQRSSADALHYQLRVRDRSRDTASAGTEIPVIRERDLSRKVVLLDVPVSDSYRSTLRVYDSAARGGMQVRMQIFAHGSSDDPIVEETLTLVQYVAYFAPEPFPGHPSIAIVDLAEAVRGKNTGPDETDSPQPPDRLRIELTPVAPLEAFWGFVSVTSNATNEVTTITP